MNTFSVITSDRSLPVHFFFYAVVRETIIIENSGNFTVCINVSKDPYYSILPRNICLRIFYKWFGQAHFVNNVITFKIF